LEASLGGNTVGSLTDFDQSGTFRLQSTIDLGPSVGKVLVPAALLTVTSGGTINVPLGVSVIRINFNGAVTVQLPRFKGAASGPLTQSATWAGMPVVICDVGGFAKANPITVLPGAGETISGLASITIASNFGAVVLQPDVQNGGATATQ
jgi:hypothetical protein